MPTCTPAHTHCSLTVSTGRVGFVGAEMEKTAEGETVRDQGGSVGQYTPNVACGPELRLE